MTETLLSENEILRRRVAELEAERDAFMEDFKKGFKEQIHREHGIYRCDICKYGGDNLNAGEVGAKCPKGCDGYSHWKWRGVKNEIEEA